MGIIIVIAVVVLLLWMWGNGTRKTVAQTIVRTEDVKDAAVALAKATPAAVEQAKVQGAQVAAQVITTSTAVGRVAAERGSAVAGVAKVKGAEFAEEAGHYVKGFASDVLLERQRIKTNRKRDRKAAKAMQDHGLRRIV